MPSPEQRYFVDNCAYTLGLIIQRTRTPLDVAGCALLGIAAAMLRCGGVPRERAEFLALDAIEFAHREDAPPVHPLNTEPTDAPSR